MRLGEIKRYEKYKDSGVEWIGEVPEGWEVKKIKYTSYVKGRIGWQGLRADEFTNEGPYLITGMHFSDDKVDWDSCYHISEERYQQAHEIQIRENDLLITKDGTIGKVAYIDKLPGKASLNSHLLVIRPLNGEYLPRFLFWVFKANYFDYYVNLTQTGTTFFGITQEKVEDFIFVTPSIDEQKRISNFLDQKTSEIDSLIADKEKLIELLQEKRQAIISEAVTKGLDKNVKMKDSGIEWIGEVPEGWEISKVKFISTYIGSGKTPKGGAEVYSDEGVMFLRSQNVHFEGLKLDEVVFISEEIDLEMKNTRVKSNDVLLNITGASIGRSSLVPNDFPKANVNQHVCIIRANKKILSSFLHKVMCSNYLQEQINLLQNGISREGLNFEQIANFNILVPELEEQRLINEFIEEKISEIDFLINQNQEQVIKFRDYRQSLISEAVTGKIMV